MFRRPALIVLACGLFAACADDDAPTGSTFTPAQSAPLLTIDGTVTLFAADAEDAAAGVAAGDFNGDGAGDVLLAAAFADGPENQREDAGEVLLFLGPFEQGETRDAALGEHDAVIYGADDGDQAGRATAAADVNGDGVDDILVGAPFADGVNNRIRDSGEVLVIFGAGDLGESVTSIDLRDAANVTIGGPEAAALNGFTLATGDLNGDEFADIVMASAWATAPGGLARAGSVHVLYGGADLEPVTDLSSQSAGITVYGPAPDLTLGESVAAGDVNGDGLDDLVLSATFAPALSGETEAGQVQILLSPPPAEVELSNADPDYVVYGADSGDQLGHSSATGDVDGDGRDDLLLGAVSSDGAGNASRLAGEVALVLGSSLQPQVDVAVGEVSSIVYGTNTLDRLGRSVAVGDVDGDGLADLVLGLPGADSVAPSVADAGALYVVRGSADVSRVLDLTEVGRAYFGSDPGEEMTSGVTGRPALLAADIDGNGRAEIIVSSASSAGSDGSRPDAGGTRILFISSL